jgi:ABC-type amino acid transport substrate-binding protein/PAS domain-containing protein
MKYYFNAILLACLIAMTSFIQHSFAQQASQSEQGKTVSNLSLEQLKQMSFELKYYDEVLTASVLNYAFFGEEKWLVRYNEYEPKLTFLIDELLANKTVHDLELISTLNKVNNLLISIENKAIQYVKNNNKEEALNIINNVEYRQYKTEYISSIMAYISQVEIRTQSSIKVSADKNSISFTEEELRWIAENKVIVGIEHWPPITLMQDDQTPSGLSGDLLQQIIDKSGLQLNYVTGTWNDLLTQFKKGDIDVLPDAFFSEDRKEFGHFSKPYFMVRELFYVKDNNTQLNSNIDLNKATIAVSSGFSTIKKIKALYPDIRIVETTGIEDSANKVINGTVDALLDAQIVVDDLIKKNNIKGLRVIEEDVVFPSSLHIYTTKDKKTLHSILVKSLDFIKVNDQINFNNEVPSKQKYSPSEISDELNDILWFVLGTIALLILLGASISSVLMKTNEEELVAKFSSSHFKKGVLASLILLSIVLIIILSFVDTYAEKKRLETLEYTLDTLLTSTHQRLTGWIEYELNALNQVGKNKELVALVEKILIVPEDPDALKDSPLQSQIRQFFQARESSINHIGFFVISPNKISLASRRDDNIGTENIIHKLRPELLTKVMQGSSVFVPTIRSGVHLFEDSQNLKNEKPSTMFFAVPIVDINGDVIAILTKRINFDGAFSTILSAGFIGKSGETYAIDNSGILLSNVRFESELKEIGILAEDARASLNIRVSDPGKNLRKETEKTSQNKEWPLTIMARQIASGRSGKNIEGYRDYRGVDVVGAWMWDDELDIGIAAEVDMVEALELQMLFRYTIFSLLFISLLLVFSGTLFTLKIGTRATKALARSQLDLENLVHERTEALEANMKRTRMIINNASDGIIVVNEKGLILEFSPAAETIFGYNAKDVLHKNIDLLMNESFNKKYMDDLHSGDEKKACYEIMGYRKNN